jgi:hypothetical protein
MKFSTETLMAYADGELDAETRQAIEAEMAVDPQVAQEVARHRALRLKLRSALGDVIHETVPDRLINAARTSPAGTRAQVTDIAAARATRKAPEKRRWSWPEWGAIAASLMLGVLGGRAALIGNSADAIVAENGRMIAGGELASALNDRPSGTQDGGGKVHVSASFRAKDGDYCRTFAVKEDAALAGLACNDAGKWNVRALAQSEKAAAGDYRMATTSMPASIAKAVEENIEGEALDADEEAAARRRGWKK